MVTLRQIPSPNVWLGPPVRHSSNHYSLFIEVKTTKSYPQGRRPFPCGIGAESMAPSRPTSVSAAPSSRLTSCAQSSFATLAVPTSCVVGKKKNERNMFSSIKKHAIRVPVAARSRLLAALPTCSRSICATGLQPQRNALVPCCLSWRQRSCVLECLLQLATLSAVWSVPFRIQTPLVSGSLRLLAILSGNEPETNMWHRILVWRCHRSFGGHICGARLRAIGDGR